MADQVFSRCSPHTLIVLLDPGSGRNQAQYAQELKGCEKLSSMSAYYIFM
ncbi:MAG TPA: hypothetical protein VK638_13840 [Edaphobacter sp.]|nr:hypothetical protein [Edaphobacter sp.]